jgi:nicotinamide riboside kinase
VFRVVVTGAESTGKSTLSAGLAAHYHAPLAPEFARTYAERVKRTLTADDVDPIARGQRASEDEALRRARGGLVVLDTDLLSTVVYATFYYRACPTWLVDDARARRPALYLLCDADGVPWTPDPVRASAADRAALHGRFVDGVRASGTAVAWLTGPPDVRLRSAIAAVAALLDTD